MLALIAQWRDAIGAHNVLDDADTLARYSKDIGRFPQPPIAVVLTPRCTGDVKKIVSINASAPSVVPLLPISTGGNWGLGGHPYSTIPSAVVDMRLMAAIRAVDTDTGVAVIEPGVTMMALSKALAATGWCVNVTASCGNTGILGNCLDRGVGFHRQRSEDLIGVEVVLANGDVMRSGAFWNLRDTPENKFHYPHGVGLNPTALFMQSGLGIVTGAVIKLIPKPQALLLIEADFLTVNLPTAMEAIKSLYATSLMTSVAKIYDTAALRNYGVDVDAESKPAFRLLGSITGTLSTIGAVQSSVQAVLEASGVFQRILFHKDPKDDVGLMEAHGRFSGIPTCEGHKRGFGPSCDLNSSSDKGWLFFLPVVPLTGPHVAAAVGIIAAVSAATGVRIGATINVLSPACVDLVTSVHFTPSDARTKAAHAALDALHTEFRARGYFSYREDCMHQDLIGTPENRRFLLALKAALDPRGMMSPGRYSPLPAAIAGPTPWPVDCGEWEAAAAAVMHPLWTKYISYQTGAGRSYPAQRSLLSSLRLKKRCLSGIGDAGDIDSSVWLFGGKYDTPIMIAPTAFHGVCHPSAELGTATGAAAAGACYVVNGFLSNIPLAKIQSAARAGSPNWLHVYIFKERDLVESMVRAAKGLGFSAVCVTVDHPTNFIVDTFLPHFIATPDLPEFRVPNLDPEWIPGQPLKGNNDGHLTWADVAWLATLTTLPIVVKGLTDPADVDIALKSGAGGIIVSDHGARQADNCVPSLEALPAVVAAVAGRVPVFVDSGIRTGGDVMRAIALGAKAVLLGRPIFWSLAVGGSEGVAALLNNMTSQLKSDMAHAGVRSLSGISLKLFDVKSSL